jgi:hypothetical protein
VFSLCPCVFVVVLRFQLVKRVDFIQARYKVPGPICSNIKNSAR